MIEKSMRDSRIDAIKIIYSCEMSGEDVGTVAANILEDNDPIALKLAMGVINNLVQIDGVISESLTNYRINRLNSVDRAIIELCTSELINGVAPSICINEALEITKIYTDIGDKKAVAFNNKVLDTVRKKLEK
ncbi:MAG: transcription antitermination protein NusB [Anaeroplasmataceae bacterium]